MRILLYLLIMLFFACKTLNTDNSKNNDFDYYIIESKYQKQWIDSEINLFHYDIKSHILRPIYLNFQEGDYLYCTTQEKHYSTQKNYFIDSISFTDIDFLFNNPFPKKHRIKIKRKNKTFEIYKVKVLGCISYWEDVGVTTTRKQEILLPFKVHTFSWDKKEKKNILNHSIFLDRLFR